MAEAAQHIPKVIDSAGASPPACAVGTHRPSLEQIVSDYLGPITQLAYRLLGWQVDVEDVVQDVFLSAAQNLNSLRDTSCIKAWLFQITLNKCRTWRWRQKLRWRFWAAQYPDQEIAVFDTPCDIQERNAWIRSAVGALPAKYREAVVLRYLEQLPASEAAKILKINKNTLNVRLLRARTMLRGKLETLENE